MPKGDWKRLKADIEDGYTPVASLFLEALAMARLSGEEKGAVLYLWRRTYGWKEGKERRREAQIGSKQWAAALSTDWRWALHVVASLVRKQVFVRRDVGQGLGYLYSMNTRVHRWKCLDLPKFMSQVQLYYGGIPIPLTVIDPDRPLVESHHPGGIAPVPLVESRHPLTLITESLHKKNIKNTERTLTGFSNLLLPVSFNSLKEMLSKSPDKIAFLMKIFGDLHSSAPAADLNGSLGGRMAGMLKMCNNDADNLLQVIWKTSSEAIDNSHLDYIQGVVRKNNAAGGKDEYAGLEAFKSYQYYRIRNNKTQDWWDGYAEDPENACIRAGWPPDICQIRRKTDKGGYSKVEVKSSHE